MRVPADLRAERFTLRPITADDAAMDFDAVVDTRDELRLWQVSSWPEDGFTAEANHADLVGLEQRHAEGRAFTYTVLDPAGSRCLGCVYLFDIGATFLQKATITEVANHRWADVDVVAYLWVRRSEAGTGLADQLLAALRSWLSIEWGFRTVVFVTSELYDAQLLQFRRAGLQLRFELQEPGKPAKHLVLG